MPIHNMYAQLSPHQRKLVDACWTAVARIFTENGYKPANADDAERLVEALAVYFRVSNTKRERKVDLPDGLDAEGRASDGNRREYW